MDLNTQRLHCKFQIRMLYRWTINAYESMVQSYTIYHMDTAKWRIILNSMIFINSIKHDAFSCFFELLFLVFVRFNCYICGWGLYYLRRKSLDILFPFGQTKTVRYLIFTFLPISRGTSIVVLKVLMDSFCWSSNFFICKNCYY